MCTAAVDKIEMDPDRNVHVQWSGQVLQVDGPVAHCEVAALAGHRAIRVAPESEGTVREILSHDEVMRIEGPDAKGLAGSEPLATGFMGSPGTD